MKDERKFFRHRVARSLRDRRVYKRAEVDGWTEACLAEYHSNLEKEPDERKATQITLRTLEENLDEAYFVPSFRRPGSRYALIVSSISFLVALILSIVALLLTDATGEYTSFYPPLLILGTILLIYTFCTYWKRKLIDYLVVVFLFFSLVAINLTLFEFAFRGSNGEIFYDLRYIFPGVLANESWRLVSLDPSQYEYIGAVYYFDPTLIVSFLCLVGSIIYNVIQGKKEYVKEKD